MSVVLHREGSEYVVRSMFPLTSYLSGARVRVERLERNTDGVHNGIALVTWLSDSDTHKILPKGPSHIGTSILVSE